MGHSSIGYGVPSFRVWCSSACMFFPNNSAGSAYPSMRAAEGFEKRHVPFGSQPKIASVAESSISRNRSSPSYRASSVCIPIVLSLKSGIVDYGLLPPPEQRKCHTAAGSKEDASAGILEYHYIQ